MFAGNKNIFKVVKHIEMPKAALKNVYLSFTKTRDDIEMKLAKYCEVISKRPIFINKT